RMALHAFDGRHTLADIRRWLIVFLRRFFASQFKRDCVPNSPKVGSGGSLSPRGDWRMPSDASVTARLAEGAASPEAADVPALRRAERGLAVLGMGSGGIGEAARGSPRQDRARRRRH